MDRKHTAPIKQAFTALMLGTLFATTSQRPSLAAPCPPTETVPTVQVEPIQITAFFLRTCAVNVGPIAADAESCTELGPVYQTASIGGHIVGITLSNGETIRWSDAVAESKTEDPVYAGNIQTIWSFSNGATITHTYDETFVYSRTTTDSRVAREAAEPSTETESTSSNPQPIARDPIPVVQLDGKSGLRHLFFVKDDENFTLHIKNNGALVDPALEQNSDCPVASAKPMVVRLDIELSKPFFTGIEGVQFTLEPQESRELTAELLPFFNRIADIDQDQLYGAQLALTMWAEEAAGEPIYQDNFNVYRFVDAADTLHADGSIHMARTLGDGPRGVVRWRPIKAYLPDNAQVRWIPRRGELAVRKKDDAFAFRFDPSATTKRRTIDEQIELRALSDGKFAGKLRAEGTVEPKQKIDLNLDAAQNELASILKSARDPRYARANPPDIGVHPALIPPAETVLFDSAAKRQALVNDIQQRLETLWGDLFRGIEITNTVDPDNGVTVTWVYNPNTKTAHGLTPGTADDDLPMLPDGHDHNGTDNLDAILDLVGNADNYNKGEFAYRLSEAINPHIVKEVRVFLNAILQHNLGYGRNSVVMRRDELINTLSKTVIHEISHTMSLDHPIQAVATNNSSTPHERQILFLNAGLTTEALAQLHFKLHGGETAPLGPYLEDHDNAVDKALDAMLADAQVIGVKNWPQGTTEPGARTFKCTGTYADQFPDINAICRSTPATDADHTYVIAFANHLGFTDIETMLLRPNYLGVLSPHTDGSATNTIKGGGADRSDFSNLAKVDETTLNVSLNTLKTDLMHGGFNDFEGDLIFQPNLTLEAMKMALALDYTPAEIERATQYYQALREAYTRWGNTGFNYN